MHAPSAPVLRLERVFNAAAEALWNAWMDPKIYAKGLNRAPGTDLVIRWGEAE